MTFNEFIDQDKPAVVDFFATWCGPCQTMIPVVQSLKMHFGDKVGIIKIDVDKNKAISLRYQIRSVPTFMIFRKGQLLWRQAGMIPGRDFEKIIDRFLQK